MALEWLEGRTLDALLEEARAAGRTRMDPAAALDLLRPVLRAIAFAHRERVIHRDLKPGNVFLAEAHGAVIPKVLDFGIAKMLSGDESPAGENIAAAGNTTRGIPAFSPDYAAPEQVSYGRTGAWTDVHALGLILTEMLSGERAYAGSERQALFEAALSEQRPTPGAKGVVVGAWEPVLAKALARRPVDRYPDAGALLEALEAGLAEVAAPPARVTVASHSRTRRFGLAAAALGILAVVAGAAYFGLRPSSPAPASKPVRLMMAVLPFENLTGDPQQEYFADGLTDGMISQLGRVSPERLAVIARTSIAQYKGTKKSAKQIGRELGVSHLLESSVKRGGNRIHIDARLIQVSDETQVWGDGYDREIREVLVLQSDIAQAIAAGVRLKLTPAQSAQLSRSRLVNPAAYDAYLRGRSFLSKWADGGGDWRQAGSYFEQAIALEPTYAAAHAALAEYMGPRALELGARAKAAALRAIELDDELPEAHRALANVLLAFDWDWVGAERHYRRALVLDPNDGEAHKMFARIPLCTGHFAEGIAERKRAAELSPLSSDAHIMVGVAYFLARRYDEAISELRRIVDINPNVRLARFHLGNAYLAKGLHREALAEAVKCGPECRRIAGCALAQAGRTAEALSEVEQLKQEPNSAVNIAHIYAKLGRRDDVFAWLEKAFQERERGLIVLRVEPGWDPVRDDPRFADLVRRIGIPELPQAQ